MGMIRPQIFFIYGQRRLQYTLRLMEFILAKIHRGHLKERMADFRMPGSKDCRADFQAPLI